MDTPAVRARALFGRRQETAGPSAAGVCLTHVTLIEDLGKGKSMKLIIGALVLMLSGCATHGSGSAPPSVEVSGRWAGDWSLHEPNAFFQEKARGNIVVDLKQNGADVTGDLMITGSPTDIPRYPTHFEGTVSGNDIILRSPYSSGVLHVRGEKMTGVVSAAGAVMLVEVSLRRQQ